MQIYYISLIFQYKYTAISKGHKYDCVVKLCLWYLQKKIYLGWGENILLIYITNKNQIGFFLSSPLAL